MLENFPRLVAQADLVRRWVYTREGVRRLIRSKGFPAPIAAVNGGRTRLWLLSEIEEYERDRPWLFSPERKRRRQGYFANKAMGGMGG